MGGIRLRVRSALVLAAVLLAWVVAGASHSDHQQLKGELARGELPLDATTAVRALRAYLTNDEDIRRYRAYAHAAMGRPHSRSFVRTLKEWETEWAIGRPVLDRERAPDVHAGVMLRPYRDYFVEYPPGLFLVIVPPALLTRDADRYATLFKLEMAACLFAAALLCADLARRAGATREGNRLPALLAAAVLALGVVSTHRYDAWVALTIVASVHAAVGGHGVTAGSWLFLGTISKGTPLLLWPLVAVFLAVSRGRGAALRFVAATAVLGAAFAIAVLAWFGSPFLDALDVQRLRVAQIESTAGASLVLSNLVIPGAVRLVESYGSANLDGAAVGAAGVAALVATGVALVVVFALTWRRMRRCDPASLAGVLVDGSVAALACFMAFGKVFSPQYLVWLLPLGLLACARPERRPLRRLFFAVLVASQLIYPVAYGPLKSLAPWAAALVLARNLALVVWAALLVRGTLSRDTHGAQLSPATPRRRP